MSLIWIVASQASAAERAASEALLRLAVTSTGKPLRDCSIAAKELAQTGSQGSPVWGSSALAGQATAPASLADLSRLMREGQKPRRRRVWLVIAPALVFFLALSALPYAGSAWLQGYQTQYLTSLPARLHAEQPLYTDSLSWNDGDWPMSTPSETSCGAGYQQGANYQLSGQVTGDTCTADTEPVYGDAAVEVTALESGKLGPKLSDGVGLVLRASEDGTDFVAFYVLASGEWDLFHSEYLDGTYTSGWPILASGTSGAIHTGFGATNRLLVLMRGNLFLLYVNDQLVGTYYARYDHLPASGHVGVYLNESSITGSFTDFAVYPVQPPSSF